MPKYKLSVNGQSKEVDIAEDMPLLWTLRDVLDLDGAKYGCGMAMCGACTVVVDGRAIRSCITAASECVGKNITTIEGISKDGSHPLQKAWIEHDVPQCGYCQTGQIMEAYALMQKKPKPTDQDIDDAMSDHICRCGTYQRIRDAIKGAAK